MTKMLPTFIIIGAQKAGTTSLAAYLSRHPDIFMGGGGEREPHFFSRVWTEAEATDRLVGAQAEYERLFAPAGDSRARGEKSTSYSMAETFPNVPNRIAELVPDVRLVYVVRHPIDRIRSAYIMRVVLGTEKRSNLRDAVREDASYLWNSSYGFQLSQYLERFPRERLMVVTSEDLRDRRRNTLESVYRFLEVDPGLVARISFDFERNVSRERARYPSVARALARALHRIRLIDRLPSRLRGMKSHLRRAPIPDGAHVSLELEEEFRVALEPDLRLLSELTGDECPSWVRGGLPPLDREAEVSRSVQDG